MQFPVTRRVRDIIGGGMLALALAIGGSTACYADSPAKVDFSYSMPPPVYPDTAKYSGEQGDVLLDVLVSAAGRPTRVRLRVSSGFPDLDNAAVENVANWHFIPAVENGDTAQAWTMVKIHFELPQDLVPILHPASATK